MNNGEKSIVDFRKSFLQLLSANTVAQFIPVLALFFIGRNYSPSEIAQFSSFVAFASIFGVISIGRVDVILPIIKDEEEAKNIFTSGFLILIATSMFSCIAIFFVDFPFSYYLPLAIFGIGINALLCSLAIRKKAIKLLALNKIVMVLINSLIAITLGFLSYSVEALIWAWLLSFYFSSLVFMALVYRKGLLKSKLPSEVLKRIYHKYKQKLGYSTLHALADVFFGQYLLFVVITFYYGEEQLGLFAFMIKYVKAPMVLVSSAISPLFLSESASLLREGKTITGVYTRTIKSSLFFAVPFCLVLLFLAPWLFEIWCGPQWREAGVMAQYLVPTLLLSFVYSPVSVLPILLEKFAFNFYICTITLLCIILIFIGGDFLQLTMLNVLILYNFVYIAFYLVMFVWGRRALRANVPIKLD